jgi:uncharacterized protein (TIGR02147 family)
MVKKAKSEDVAITPRKPKGDAKGQAVAESLVVPDILHYTQYRVYLKDYLQIAKENDPKFSLRAFAQKADFSGHGHLRFVLDGKRNLSKRSLLKLVLALDLPKERASYLENLVFFNQAQTLDEKNHYYQELLKSRNETAFRKLDASQFDLFRQWHHTVIREMIGLKGFRPHPDWIASQLLPKLEPEEVRTSLKLMQQTGLIAKTANGFRSVDEAITTDDEVLNLFVHNYHAQMIALAGKALETVPPEQRDISSVCFKIRKADFPKLKRQIQLMRKEFRGFAAEDGTGDKVVQVNIQLFPVSQG